MKINYHCNYSLLHSLWCWLFILLVILFHCTSNSVQQKQSQRKIKLPCGRANMSGHCRNATIKTVNNNVTKVEAQMQLKINYLQHSLLAFYNRHTRPVRNVSNPILIEIGLQLFQINNLDELTQQMTTTLRISLRWTDEFLRWDAVNPLNRFPETLSIKPDRVWTPDLILANSMHNHKYDYQGRFNYLLSVDYLGNVRWVFPMKFTSMCALNLDYYPFDAATCALIFRSSARTNDQLVLKKYRKGIKLDLKIDAVYNVTGFSIEEYDEALSNSNYNVSVVNVKFRMKRNLNFYLNKIILPYTVFYVISTFTYLLPVDSGEKKSYSTSILLSAMLFLKDISLYIPKTSLFPLLSVYYSFNLILLYVCIIISIVVYAIFYTQMKSVPVPRVFRNLMNKYFEKQIQKKLLLNRNKLWRKSVRFHEQRNSEGKVVLVVLAGDEEESAQNRDYDDHGDLQVTVVPSTEAAVYEDKLGRVTLKLLKSIKYNLLNMDVQRKKEKSRRKQDVSFLKLLNILEDYKNALNTDKEKERKRRRRRRRLIVCANLELVQRQTEISTLILKVLKKINRELHREMFVKQQQQVKNDDVRVSGLIKGYEINQIKSNFDKVLNKHRVNSLAQNSKWKHLAIYTDRVIFVIYAFLIPISLALMYHHAQVHSDDDLL